MKATLWGTRGSLAAPGPETVGYGGNTACVEVRSRGGATLVLDAGTGIRRLGLALASEEGRIDILLSHLHVDHIQGLGFFAPLFQPGRVIHIWGPPSTTMNLRMRLGRYLSPPLFPVPLRELPSDITLHDVPLQPFEIEGLRVCADLVCHPGSSVGYRIEEAGKALTYIPDHEPALGARVFPGRPDWISGYALALGADLLIHDAQYTDEEYLARIGWGHSSMTQAIQFAIAAEVRRLVGFHHDPDHSDDMLDRLCADLVRQELPFDFKPGWEGATYEV
ncbi:MAG TPA: MBL fold metallo-hydrolase [Dehalococcoidia bacterium]|nr:MBL fold metallo-hydrolase [Dehalococcoidia bacterium]